MYCSIFEVKKKKKKEMHIPFLTSAFLLAGFTQDTEADGSNPVWQFLCLIQHSLFFSLIMGDIQIHYTVTQPLQ